MSRVQEEILAWNRVGALILLGGTGAARWN